MPPNASPDRGARRAVTAVFLANGLAVASSVVRVPDVRDRLGLREATLGLVLSSLAVGVVAGMNAQGVGVERGYGRSIMLGLHGAWSLGSLGQAATMPEWS